MAAILLIDDDSAVREVLENVFSLHHECHAADRSEHAIEVLESRHYDVVITDISMPGLGGLEAVRRIRQRHAIPIIVLSGGGEEYRDEALAAGAFAFLAKPFRLDDLEAAVAAALATRSHRAA